jgi:hypothetical protein
MKKSKWPWPFGKKKEVRRSPIDISDFKEDLKPFLERTKELRALGKVITDRYAAAHQALWDKVVEIVGHELNGAWTFDVDEGVVYFSGEGEVPEVQEPSEKSSYEKHWEGMLATFYKN